MTIEEAKRCLVQILEATAKYEESTGKDTMSLQCHIPYFQSVIETIIKELNADCPNWIPCSERLPHNDGDIIMTTDTRHVVVGFHSDGAWYYINKEGTLSRNYDEENAIVAWMPLPESYKGENER